MVCGGRDNLHKCMAGITMWRVSTEWITFSADAFDDKLFYGTEATAIRFDRQIYSVHTWSLSVSSVAILDVIGI